MRLSLLLWCGLTFCRKSDAFSFGVKQGRKVQLKDDSATELPSLGGAYARIDKIEAIKVPGLKTKYPPWKTTTCPDGSRGACGTWRPYVVSRLRLLPDSPIMSCANQWPTVLPYCAQAIRCPRAHAAIHCEAGRHNRARDKVGHLRAESSFKDSASGPAATNGRLAKS